MVKIRITGIPGEVEEAVKKLEESFFILSKSGDYENRNSVYVRSYIEAEIKDGLAESQSSPGKRTRIRKCIKP